LQRFFARLQSNEFRVRHHVNTPEVRLEGVEVAVGCFTLGTIVFRGVHRLP
jgi:hypothetical protein